VAELDFGLQYSIMDALFLMLPVAPNHYQILPQFPGMAKCAGKQGKEQ
jgi:hypothetical protein